MKIASQASFPALQHQLSQGLSQLGLRLDDEQQARLLAYVALLEKWNRVYNLTAVREPERMVGLHILDSLSVLPALAGTRTLVDVGTGAGLPGIPIAIARPDLSVTLLDTIAKKTAFVRQAVNELALVNAEVATARVEQFSPVGRFDVVISRAFAELRDFVESAGHLCAAEGLMLAMKGVYPHDEIARLPDGFRVKEAVALDVPQVDGQRHLITITKT